jgi:rhamnose utilization protein RhaD (predicted bifunctional aldolase and dehydrogenase)
MLPSKALLDLKEISREIGSDPALVQGGGGNTSVKAPNGLMAIKASGCSLSEVSETDGYCWVDYRKIRAGLSTKLENDEAYEELLRSSTVKESRLKPSMESGFHALLDASVIHSHSVYVNLITCALEGESIIKKRFPQALWLPYSTPGRQLSLELAKALSLRKEIPSLVFLANHGLIISAETANEALALHKETQAAIFAKLGNIPQFDLQQEIRNGEDTQEIIFPDQAVYCRDKTSRESRSGRENAAAAKYVHRTMKSLKLTPHFLLESEIKEIEEMQAEIYRRAKAST